ncbi:SDR family oxidoreductase [Hydrogenophaga sp. PAMC20947]|uniref:SDR family oxidoreductase n=1 Tax=Hydrogenophaga sp. PAMC20947 TaxID=2565558 RepID=UPI00109DF734|nr:SDR family oxidoreductase [Hydrogenophaga sp. PAMC20947]QCB46754.1 SDR family oxidoreductase [Hydrogenophaga sp. PAMC20947]
MNSTDRPAPPHPLFSLKNQVALVTGASRGLGFEMARALANHGAQVWLGGRDLDALQAAAECIQEHCRVHGGSVHPLPVDLTDPGLSSAALETLLKQSGRLDILINNAGQRRREPLEQLPSAALRELLETNLIAAWHLCREAARPMRAQGSGCIINITSIAGPIARAGDAAYTTSKGALDAMTRALAAELGPDGIRVNAIAPGFFSTEANANMVSDPQIQSWLDKRTSLGRWGQPHEVAGAAVFLASGAATYITGQTLTIDGGFLSHF